jgi:hypothetical protein
MPLYTDVTEFSGNSQLQIRASKGSRYAHKMIAHYTASGQGRIKNQVYGLPDLIQGDPARQAPVYRDGLRFDASYLSFERSLGHGYELENKASFSKGFVTFLIRPRIVRDTVQHTAQVYVLLALGNLDIHMFRQEGTNALSIRIRRPDRIVYYDLDTSYGQESWFFIGIHTTGSFLYLDLQKVSGDARTLQSDSDLTHFRFDVGIDDIGRGYTDMDLIDLRMYEGDFNEFEALKIMQSFSLNYAPPQATFVGTSHTNVLKSTQRLNGVATFSGSSLVTLRESSTPEDLEGLSFWWNGQDLDFEDCDRVPTWFGSLNKDLSFSSVSSCQPRYHEAMLGGGPGLIFGRDQVGKMLCNTSGLVQSDYDLWIVFEAPKQYACYALLEITWGLRIHLSRSHNELNLHITTNPGFREARSQDYLRSVTANKPSLINLRQQNNTLEVFLDGVLLTPTQEDSPVLIEDFVLEGCSGELEPENLLALPGLQSFEIAQEGDLCLGNYKGLKIGQVLGYHRILDPEETIFVRSWFENLYDF